MSTTHLSFTEVKTPKGLAGVLKVKVEETLDLSCVSLAMQRRVRSALTKGLAPVADTNTGQLAVIYRALCNIYDMPCGFLSKQGKGLLVEDAPDDMQLELEALHLLAKETDDVARANSQYYYSRYSNITRYESRGRRRGFIKTYHTAIPFVALANSIDKFRPVDPEKVKAAIATLENGDEITYKHNVTT